MPTAAAGVVGKAPCVLVQPVPNPEQDKYRRMWENPNYRTTSPGEIIAQVFLAHTNARPGDTCIDFGTGTGRGALMLALFGRLNVTMVDFASNCLDKDIQDMLITQPHALRFVEADLRKPIPVQAKYGYCTDVMEHIPTEDVDKVLFNILRSAEHVFFQISTRPDNFGDEISGPLHLTVKPAVWWRKKLEEHDAVVHFAMGTEDTVVFYCTAWNNASELVKRGVINSTDTELMNNVRSSIERGLPQAQPHVRQNKPVMILAGGPSMRQFVDEIKSKREAGQILVTLNGAYNWAIEQGLKPSAQVIVDAREFNNRFVTPHVEGCKYMLASQCHPSVFDAAPAEQTLLWHTAMADELCDELDKKFGETGWHPVPGGSTVALRVIPLLRMLGFWRFEFYGLDSCLMGDDHHAYAQPENDSVRSIAMTCGGRVFQCHPWMASQAQEFLDLTALLRDEVELVVHGDGLIAHIIQTAADLEDLEVQEAA